ncbi:MarR family transcriptional regulator [Oceanobacillus sp. AG]|uniref:MarR family transcriptional regulator n=1 Tax=Oceanobacillus sp. AG TaxID=2681969 RepID=UPI0012EC3A34|nr:MarR family transcriptional regulator [Oceanobacillus sp. AG]
MKPTEGLKRLLYERFLHFTHLFEQIFSTEIDEFVHLARLQGITSWPNNMTSVHVIDCIGNNEPINNTSIAEKMNLSKASISKISSNLIKEGYIKRSQMNDNKKEVYFYLSPKGRQIFELHTMMHEKIERRFINVFDSFSESELQASLKFFQTMIDQRDSIVKGDDRHDEVKL